MRSNSLRPFDEQKLDKIIEIFLENLKKTNPELKSQIESRKEEIVKLLRETLRQQKPELNPRDLADKTSVKELIMTILIAIVEKLSFDEDKELLKKLETLLKSDKRLELLLNPKSLEKLLTPKELEKIRNIIKKHCAEVVKTMEKAGIKFKPTPGKKPEDELAKQFDRYENLFSLLNSAVTGSHPSVVQCMLGNGLGIADQNPNKGYAQIDRINNPQETGEEDALSLNAKTQQNFLQFSGDELVDTIQNNFIAEGLGENNTPRFTPPTGGGGGN